MSRPKQLQHRSERSACRARPAGCGHRAHTHCPGAPPAAEPTGALPPGFSCPSWDRGDGEPCPGCGSTRGPSRVVPEPGTGAKVPLRAPERGCPVILGGRRSAPLQPELRGFGTQVGG
ncbi:unnamed protein product [Coccothraustes coccothraustes]